jgi:arylsulfatase A-like enzyme
MHMTTQSQRRSRFLNQVVSLLLLASATVSAGMAADPPAQKPNFVFILVDDMSWGDLGCFGHPYAKTPNLDRMAEQGIKFTQFYVCAVECAPSRSALLTGRVPCKAGKSGNGQQRLDPSLPNVNKLLKPAGYATGHFGKWHLYNGFKDPPDSERAQYQIDEWFLSSANGHTADTAREATDHALGFIDRHKDNPFHMNVWYVWPHLPTNPNAAQVAVYNDLATVDVTTFHPTMQAKYKQIKHLHPGYDLTDRMKNYLATISDLDKQVGRIVAKLDALKLSQDTLVVFSSDQGAVANNITKVDKHDMWPANAGPYRGGKFEYLEGGIRMPCVAQWKGRLKGGQVNDSLWRTVDWLPTVCSLAGVETKGITLDGQDVSDILLGAHRERKEPIFWQGAVREGNWKLVQGGLYNLETDPSEQNNLAKKEAERAQRMKNLLQEWLKK